MTKITDSISQAIKMFKARDVNETTEESTHLKLDIREEYANAFRTESYVEFWDRVLELNKGHHPTSQSSVSGSTTAARLSSYRLFVDHLLDPDQPTAQQTLDLISVRPTIQSNLLINYFSETANAFNNFSQLLKNLDNIRIKYKPLKPILNSDQLSQLISFSISLNQLNPLALFPNSIGFEKVQADCSVLLRQLESSRDKTQAKVRLAKKLKHGSALFLVAITATVSILVVAHALALLAVAPGVVVASYKLVSAKKLGRWISQLDAAAKGTYILIRDLETMPRLVARLTDGLEHMQGIIQLLANKKGEDRLQAGGEVVRQLKINYISFCEQLDELEEHLYLCLMTINRARNLVLKEIIHQWANH